MLASVEFDDDAVAETNKVANIIADRSLPAEPKAGELTVAQPAPKQTFGVGGIATEGFGEMVHSQSTR